jgi:hypothetical protein
MAQNNMSPAGAALNLQVGASPTPYESEDEKRKRLAALQASQNIIGRSLGRVGG